MRLGILYAFFLRLTVRLVEPLAVANAKSIYRARQRHALRSTVEYVEQNMRNVQSTCNKKHLLTRAFAVADVSEGRLICEFGVFKGDTLNHIARLSGGNVYGFDSFEGLPSGQSDHWSEGDFKVFTLPKVRSNVTLVKGWFDQTLPRFLSEHKQVAGFIHIDCDLYYSTKTIFSLMGERLRPGSVIVFDEFFNYPSWQEGEFRALQEFLEETGYGVEFIGYNRFGEQVAIRLAES